MKTKTKLKDTLKVMTILGTRPEIIRLCRVLPKLDDYFNHVIVYTQQSYDYELSKIFFEELELRKPDYLLSVKSETLGGQIANIIQQTEAVLLKEKPDALLVLGDTNSSLSAITARRMGIPIFHMEAGNRCFNWEVPEETNRAIVDIISDYNLPYAEHGRRYLMTQGIHPSKIFVTGSPLAEVYDFFDKKIEKSSILSDLQLKKGKYFVVSMHREENVDNKQRLEQLIDSLNYIADTYKMPLIVTLHPRTKKRFTGKELFHKLIRFNRPFGILEYIKLEKNAYCVISDSGTIQEESSMLSFPGIQIRTNMERPEAFDSGSMILAGVNKNSIVNAIECTVKDFKENGKPQIPVDYRDKNVSTKVAKLIMGFAGINKYQNSN